MKMIFTAAICLCVLVVAIRYLERKSVFFPTKRLFNTPADAGLSYEEVWLFTEDNRRLNAWLVQAKGSRYTVLFSHGNAGNIGDRIDKIEMLIDSGFNVFIYDYRGYGKSNGSPSEKGMYRDADAAYEYLVNREDVGPEKIVLYGESIGAAVSIELASRKEVFALISEAGFTSFRDMARMSFPVIPSFVFANKFDSLSKTGKIECPKLFIHSHSDEIVPFEQGLRLFAAAGYPKTFLKLRGGHNTAFWDSREEYKSGIKEFIESSVKKREGKEEL